MQNGDGNENGFKINRSNEQRKNKLHVQHTFFSNQQKNKLARAARFLSFFAVVLQTSNFLVTHYFDRIVVCAYPIYCFLCSCSLLFFTAPHFHLAGRSLLAASISHCLTAALNFYVFLPTKFGCSSFSVIHVNVNIKNNIEKYMTVYFSLRAKCWLRGGVGGQFPRSV